MAVQITDGKATTLNHNYGVYTVDPRLFSKGFGGGMPLLFCLFSYFLYEHYSNSFIQYNYPSPFVKVHRPGTQSEKPLSGMPRRELNSDLPYSKPMRYQLFYIVPVLFCFFCFSFFHK
jgi:hypothetical protein